jgi:hypothetical protein
VVCQTPTSGKQPTRIERWEFELLGSAILAELTEEGEGVPFQEPAGRIHSRLPPAELERRGSLRWYTTTVKPDLDFKVEIERGRGKRNQHLRL